MAKTTSNPLHPASGSVGNQKYNRWVTGQLSLIDDLEHGDSAVAGAIQTYANSVDSSRQSALWRRCFPKGKLVVRPDGTLTPIEELEVGDMVVSPSGPTEVKDNVKYNVNEDLITLGVRGNLPITSVKEHKHWVLKKEHILDGRKDKRQRIRKQIDGIRRFIGAPDWPVTQDKLEKVEAKDIRVGDYLVVGFNRIRDRSSKLVVKDYISHSRTVGRPRKPLPEVIDIDKEFLRIAGLYLGDGTANFSNGNVKWIFGENEKHLAEEVLSYLNRIGISGSVRHRLNHYAVVASSRHLVELFQVLLGGGDKPKIIHNDIFHSDVDLTPLVYGLKDADSTGGPNGIGQADKNLLSQIRSILLDSNVPCAFRKVENATNPAGFYKIWVPNWALRGAISKSHTPYQLFIRGGFFGFPVESTEHNTYEGEVYDISVKDKTHLFQVESNLFSSNTIVWMENILFGLGRHYLNDILLNRLTTGDSGDRKLFRDALNRVPKPTNDLLGRYVETNISLLTENRPRPRITAKSDRYDDRKSAELAELTMEYLWDELDLAEKHREMARMALYTGCCWLEVCYDPLIPRYTSVPETREEQVTIAPGEGGMPIELPVSRQVPVIGEGGLPELKSKIEYGDIVARVISPFEMHVPAVDYWNGEKMGWIMKEQYYPIDILKQLWTAKGTKRVTTKANGWFLDNLQDVSDYDVQNLPLWWYERLADLVEGPGPTVYMGSPERWANHTVVRTFDRKPSAKWPKGRTVITAGDKVIYDSPKKIGARAFNPRWPHRWHPYTKYTWEKQLGSVWGRSLVTKLLPKLKRVNSIDVSLIMWRRTVPISTWVAPKGSNPVSDLWKGGAGNIWEYDARLTQGRAPTPVYPPPFPDGLLVEREKQIEEMEGIAGTEEILRGQRPTGTTSGAMLEYLRKNALASRSPILQAWDQSIETTGQSILMEVSKNVKDDPKYAERLRILAREKASRLTIKSFTGMDIKDNMIVRVDTASEAMTSREAKQVRAVEVMQFAEGLMILPPTLRKQIVDDLGWPDSFTPQSADIQRAQFLLSLIRQDKFDIVVPFPEDDPYIFHEFFVDTLKSEEFLDMPPPQQQKIIEMAQGYEKEIQKIEMQRLEMQMQLGSMEADQQAQAKPPTEGGGEV